MALSLDLLGLAAGLFVVASRTYDRGGCVTYQNGVPIGVSGNMASRTLPAPAEADEYDT